MTISNVIAFLVAMAATLSPVASFSPVVTTQQKLFVASASASTQLNMATWSDSRAVKEYQEFLASGRQDIEKTPDMPSVIIKSEGESELADAIVQMGLGGDVVLLPGAEAPPDVAGNPSYPIYITVPPQQLREFLKNLPPTFQERTDDFIFVSGGPKYGNIEQILKDTGYCRDTMTQFLASGFKTKPIIEDTSSKMGMAANGDEKIAGECSACGKWSGSVEERLAKTNIRCKTVFYREWRRLMWERSIYDAVFNLVGALRIEPTTMLDVANYYGEEVSDITWQISGVLRGMKAITLTYGFEERLFGVAEATGADKPCMLDDDMFPYIYAPFAMASTLGEYLDYAQDERGLLQGVERVRRAADKKPIMRQGNLRADGVI